MLGGDSGVRGAGRRTVTSLAVALVAAGLLWWSQGDDGTPTDVVEPQPSASTTLHTAAPVTPEPSTAEPSTAEPSAGTDPMSGLEWVALADLPPEARDTVRLIDAGGPFPHDEDDGTFGNFEGILPDRERGHYREYTVETPGLDHRGARRIVAGADGELYWTADHYESFARVTR